MAMIKSPTEFDAYELNSAIKVKYMWQDLKSHVKKKGMKSREKHLSYCFPLTGSRNRRGLSDRDPVFPLQRWNQGDKPNLQTRWDDIDDDKMTELSLLCLCHSSATLCPGSCPTSVSTCQELYLFMNHYHIWWCSSSKFVFLLYINVFILYLWQVQWQKKFNLRFLHCQNIRGLWRTPLVETLQVISVDSWSLWPRYIRHTVFMHK